MFYQFFRFTNGKYNIFSAFFDVFIRHFFLFLIKWLVFNELSPQTLSLNCF